MTAAGTPIARPWRGALIQGAMSAGMRALQGSTPRESIMGGAAAGMSKISGIPLPGKTGTALGTEKRAELDAQFPGTNPWEQMKGSPATSGAVQVERQKAKTAKELQTKELQTRKDVANIGAQAHVQAAATQAGPQAVASAKAAQANPAEAILPYITESMQKALLTGTEIEFAKARLVFKNQIALAGLTKDQLATIYTTIAHSIREVQAGRPGPITGALVGKVATGTVLGAIGLFFIKRARALAQVVRVVMKGKPKRPPPTAPKGAPRPRPGSQPPPPMKTGGLRQRSMPPRGDKKPRRVFPKR